MKVVFALAALFGAVLAELPYPSSLEYPAGDIDEFEQTPHIVGGTAAASGEFPYIVSLSSGGSHFCGGTLLNAYTVITAAHCSTGLTLSNLRVRAGSINWTTGGVLRRVKEIRIHPGYVESTFDNDIALWRLAYPIRANGNTIKYATLAKPNTDPPKGMKATTAGWGYTSEGAISLPKFLRKVTVPIVARTTCNQAYFNGVTVNMFCAGYAEGGKDSCQGDSGGPMVNPYKQLIGIVSWGVGCARPNLPGVYTRVSRYLTWISTNDWTS